MERVDKADRIGGMLDELYPKPPIPLEHRDPYTLLVAVTLSAQTTDAKVNEVTPALFAEADTPEKMVALGPDRILHLIRAIGLAPTKARNLSRAAAQIVEARDTWARRHLQIIYFGRAFCPARHHDLTACPICSWAATKTRIRDEAIR